MATTATSSPGTLGGKSGAPMEHGTERRLSPSSVCTSREGYLRERYRLNAVDGSTPHAWHHLMNSARSMRRLPTSQL